MNEQRIGPHVRRIGYFDQISDITVRISQEPEQWAAVAWSGRWSTNHIERGADAESAAAAMIVWLEQQGELVPEPPADFWPWAL